MFRTTKIRLPFSVKTQKPVAIPLGLLPRESTNVVLRRVMQKHTSFESPDIYSLILAR